MHWHTAPNEAMKVAVTTTATICEHVRLKRKEMIPKMSRRLAPAPATTTTTTTTPPPLYRSSNSHK